MKPLHSARITLELHGPVSADDRQKIEALAKIDRKGTPLARAIKLVGELGAECLFVSRAEIRFIDAHAAGDRVDVHARIEFVAAVLSNHAQQVEDQKNEQQRPDPAGGVVAPGLAVRPGGQGADERKD